MSYLRRVLRTWAFMAWLLLCLPAIGCGRGSKPIQASHDEKPSNDSADRKKKMESMQKQLDLLTTPNNPQSPERMSP